MMIPINFRLGKRHLVRPGQETYMRNIVIDRLRGDCEEWIPSTLLGVPGLRPQNITFRNFNIVCQGNGHITDDPIPEREAGYPSPGIFGLHTLPAFYAEDCPGLDASGLKDFP